jgi:hypothetical protein
MLAPSPAFGVISPLMFIEWQPVELHGASTMALPPGRHLSAPALVPSRRQIPAPGPYHA